MASLQDLINNRRSIYKFTDEIFDDEDENTN